MDSRRFRIGLWARMGVATAVALVGLGLLLVVEFVFATAVAIILLFYAPVWGVIGFWLAGVVVSGILCWKLVAAGLGALGPPGTVSDRIADDGVADLVARMGRTARNPPALRDAYRGLGIVAGASVGLILGHVLLFDLLGVDTWWLSIAVGATAAVGYTGWLCYDELRSAGAVRAELEDEYDVLTDTDRQTAVQRRVERLAKQAGCPVPEVRIGASWNPQAATAGYRPQRSVIIVSRGLLDTLDGRELDAVLAHELSHLLNRDAAVLTALSVPRTKALGLAERTGILGMLVAIPVYVTNLLSVPVVARYREYVADHAAAELTGDPAALAGALAAISDGRAATAGDDMRTSSTAAAFGIVPPPWRERKFFDRATRFLRRRVFGTHPPTEARIQRLQAQTKPT